MGAKRASLNADLPNSNQPKQKLIKPWVKVNVLRYVIKSYFTCNDDKSFPVYLEQAMKPMTSFSICFSFVLSLLSFAVINNGLHDRSCRFAIWSPSCVLHTTAKKYAYSGHICAGINRKIVVYSLEGYLESN